MVKQLLTNIAVPRRALYVGAVLVCAVAGVNLYRAQAQSLVHDEALTYNWYIAGTLDWFLYPNANNHALHTFLAKGSVKLVGHSPLGLRMPSLVGGMLAMAAIWSIGALVCRGTWSFLLLLALAVLNPHFLDYACAARGYGLSTAFLLCAIVCAVLMLRPEMKTVGRQSDWLLAISVLLGLSLASNLSILFVDIGVAAIIALTVLASATNRLRSAGSLLLWFAVPGPFIAFAFWWPMLVLYGKGHFYVGWGSWFDCVAEYVTATLFHRQSGIDSLAAQSLTPLQLLGEQSAAATAVYIIARFVIPIAFIFLSFIGLWLLVRVAKARSNAESSPRAALLMCLGALVLSGIAFVAMHKLRGVLYPPERAIAFVGPLAAIVGVLFVQEFVPRRTTFIAPFFATGVLILSLFIWNFNTDHFRTWRFDTGIQRFVSKLATAKAPGQAMLVGGSWLHEPTLLVYKHLMVKRREHPWLISAERHADINTCDAVITHPADKLSVPAENWHLLDVDPRSGAQLYVRRHPRVSQR